MRPGRRDRRAARHHARVQRCDGGNAAPDRVAAISDHAIRVLAVAETTGGGPELVRRGLEQPSACATPHLEPSAAAPRSPQRALQSMSAPESLFQRGASRSPSRSRPPPATSRPRPVLRGSAQSLIGPIRVRALRSEVAPTRRCAARAHAIVSRDAGPRRTPSMIDTPYGRRPSASDTPGGRARDRQSTHRADLRARHRTTSERHSARQQAARRRVVPHHAVECRAQAHRSARQSAYPQNGSATHRPPLQNSGAQQSAWLAHAPQVPPTHAPPAQSQALVQVSTGGAPHSAVFGSSTAVS